MNYTDDQLKQLLAKMLPETVKHARGALRWICDDEDRVLDTELLHLCSLVEAVLGYDEQNAYSALISRICEPKFAHVGGTGKSNMFKFIHATWQQRTAALAEVKGGVL